MSDAIVVFHPKDASALEALLDLDEDSSDSPHPFAEKIADDVYLVHTFEPYSSFTEEPDRLADWLEHFDDVFELIHDDPRGVFVFPDDHEPEATEYEALLQELAEHGAFFQMDDGPILDLEALSALSTGNSFEIGQLIQTMQSQIADALGVQLEEKNENAAAEAPLLPKRSGSDPDES